jgi:gem associated protein 7
VGYFFINDFMYSYWNEVEYIYFTYFVNTIFFSIFIHIHILHIFFLALVKMSVSEVAKQEQRTFLRERFLRLLSHLSGQEAKINLHERTSVSCVLGTMDIDIHHIQVSNLTTPMGNIPHAVLRMSDVISIEVPDLNTKNS